MKASALRWLLGVALLGLVGATLAFRDRFDVAALQAWVENAGTAGPVIFIVIYAAATVLFLPGAVITLAGGALFGPVWGTLWNLSGATLGALLAFLIARHLGADWVAQRAGPRLRNLNEGVSAEGWRFVAFVRLVPLFPVQPAELRARPHTHSTAGLYAGQRHLHAPRRAGLHLARIQPAARRWRAARTWCAMSSSLWRWSPLCPSFRA